jgi:uncharacterized repeat protein (TIGR01451 family)
MLRNAWRRWLRALKAPNTRRGRPARARRAPLGLESLEDRWLPSTFTVLNTNDAGPGSLRQAILDANAHPNSGGPDRIEFNLAATDPNHVYYRDDGASGRVSRANLAVTTASDDTAITDIDPDWRHSWWTIRPATLLPAVTDPVVIDGTTQSGWSPNTAAVGTNAVLTVELDGSLIPGANALRYGLYLTAGNNTVTGLTVNQFQNPGPGILMDSIGGNVIAGNFVGTDPSGTVALGNGGGGVDITPGLGACTVGGTAPAARNLISGNTYYGVAAGSVYGGATVTGLVVQGNLIGTNAAGTAALPNDSGLFLGNVTDSIVGGTTPGAGNVISGNSSSGIRMLARDGDITNLAVQGNFIGTDATGAAALPNAGDGITMGVFFYDGYWHGTITETIGGVNEVEPDGSVRRTAGNVISGNGGNGISWGGQNMQVLVEGNYIGTDATGTAAIGNIQPGIYVNGPNSTIGGTTPGAGNLISGNTASSGAAGIAVGSHDNIIEGNLIGTDITGTAALPNRVGIDIRAAHVTVGGATTAARNVISGNQTFGVNLEAAATGDRVQNNYIGTDVTGMHDVGNGSDGVILSFYNQSGVLSSDNLIGGPGTGNLIAFNAGDGVGVSTNPTSPLDATIDSNTIIHNHGSGVGISPNAHVLITRNSIASNGRLGIDLAGGNDPPSGVTPNDPGDADTGPNDLQNFPALASAITAGGNTTVTGTLDSSPGGTFTIEFFASTTANPSGYGEGQTYLGQATVTTDATGHGAFSAALPAVAAGQLLTATATDAGGNTSEFSAVLPTQAPQDVDLAVTLTDTPDPLTAGGNLTYHLAVANHGAGTATGVSLADALPAGVTFVSATTSQGSYTRNGGNLTFSLGSLAGGGHADLTVVVNATRAGTLATTATATADQQDSNPADNTASEQTTVQPAAATHFRLTAPSASTAGGAFTFTVTAQDNFNNTVTGYGGTVHFTSSDANAAPPADSTLTNGVGTFTAALRTVGNQTLTATDTAASSVSGTSGMIAVSAAAATHFRLSAPAAALPGSTFLLQVTALDDFNNVTTSYTGAVHFTTSDRFGAVTPPDYTFRPADRGSRQLTATLRTIGTQTITATDTQSPTVAGTAGVLVAPTGPVTFRVTNTNDSGPGSLRQALLDANAHAGKDTVSFGIATSGVQTIHVGGDGLGALPTVTDPVLIDGTTEPGYAGRPLVVLDGSGAGTDAVGLDVTAGGSTIKGLVIGGFGGDAILLETLGGDVVQGNYLGTDATGTTAVANLRGVEITSANNQVGGTSLASRNVIGGNRLSDVRIFSASATGNKVQGNYLGIDVTGTHVLGDNYGVAIAGGASNNLVGGTIAGARNVIAGSRAGGAGVLMQDSGTSGNAVQGNFIGTDYLGTHALGNFWGVEIINGAANNLVGGTIAGARNVIAGSRAGGAGILIQDSGTSGNAVQGNFIGTDYLGTHTLGNAWGVAIQGGAANNLIGGTALGARNVIAGSQYDGVYISDVGTTGNQVQGNFIGTDVLGTHSLANGRNGVILLAGASGNMIGGTAAGARNVIAGNGNDGIQFDDAATTGNWVQGNYVGTDVAGTRPLGNTYSGVAIFFAAGNTIGGTSPAARNVISGNGTYGIYVGAATGIVVQGNFIGTDVSGTHALANGQDGVILFAGASGNTVGGTAPGARNIISGNAADGLTIQDAGTTGNAVQGNFIGTDVSGTRALGNLTGVSLIGGSANTTVGGNSAGSGNVIAGNRQYGVLIDASAGNFIEGNAIGAAAGGLRGLANIRAGVRLQNGANGNTIGGASSRDPTTGKLTGAGNVISGNEHGIWVEQASGNAIQGNYIGTDVTGTHALANSEGVDLAAGATGNTVGGTATGAGNVISGNDEGIAIDGETTMGNQVQGNFIGTDFSGTHTLANSTGVYLFDGASGNTVGGTTPGARNVISGNNDSGVSLQGAFDGSVTTGNSVQGNYIGTDLTGTHALGNRYGVVIDFGGANNLVGGSDTGARNVISGNRSNGVWIRLAGTTGNSVQGNYIGTDRTGTLGLANGGSGVAIVLGASGNTVGGTDAGAGNLISGNGSDGVTISDAGTTGNLVQGNLIGTDLTGTQALGNTGNGVYVLGAAGNTVGGTEAGAGNLISVNYSVGVRIDGAGATNNIVQGNVIGTDATGTVRLSNLYGVIITDGANRNTVGGTLPGARNVISGNRVDGVYIRNSASENVVQGNYIGTDPSGSQAVANGEDGVSIQYNGMGNIIGGTQAGAENLISGNQNDGVFIGLGGGNTVEGNLIGTDATGTRALPNAYDGVDIYRSDNNVIGGTDVAARNVISGNGAAGFNGAVGVWVASSNGTLIQGNFIGTDLTGLAAVPNWGNGVEVHGGNDTTVGGGTPGAANVISGNQYDGVYVADSGSTALRNRIQGNLIGTDATGAFALPNRKSGVEIQGSNYLVGGTAAGEGNVVSGNAGDGVLISIGNWTGARSTANTVQGNFIGTDASGTFALGNGASGVEVRGDTNVISGTAPGAGNVIAANGRDGVLLTGSTATANHLFGNFIGTDVTAGLDLGNLGSGVHVTSSASYNVIGDARADGTANTIAFNHGDGVFIDSGSGNLASGDTLFANVGLGIHLNPATAANNRQPAPVLTTLAVNAAAQTVIVQGTMAGPVGSVVTLEFYANAPGDSPQGRRFLGSVRVTITANQRFTVTLSAALDAGEFLTATATGAGGNTSPFSGVLRQP